MAALQVLVERSRWQMIPAYALSIVFCLIALLPNRGPAHVARRGTARRVMRVAGVALGALLLVISTALPILIPIFRFPQPDGPYAIGTMTYHWVDPARPEVFTPNPGDHRELMVQVWYPAKRDDSARRAPYVPDSSVLAALARLFGLPAFTFSHLQYVKTHAEPSAPVASGQRKYPVLLFSHGRGGFRQHNTFQVEQLASHGYVVATIDQPYVASGVVFPDGRLVKFDSRMFDPGHPGHPAFLDEVIPFLAQDVIFTLDQLARLNQADPNGILTGHLDLPRAGAFGVSLGGAVIAEACRLEPRLRGCLVMDVFMPADVVQSGLRQPVMWITRDAASMQREGWAQRDIDETRTTMRAVFDRLPGQGYIVLVPGMFHPNFSDFPLYSPIGRWMGLTGPIDPQRGHEIVDAYTLAFFDRHVADRPAPLLDQRPSPYREAIFETRR
ncbi:MAG TPA: hypothetical protein VH458_19555 [Vicinamibacterales bacterium]